MECCLVLSLVLVAVVAPVSLVPVIIPVPFASASAPAMAVTTSSAKASTVSASEVLSPSTSPITSIVGAWFFLLSLACVDCCSEALEVLQCLNVSLLKQCVFVNINISRVFFQVDNGVSAFGPCCFKSLLELQFAHALMR